MLTDPSTAYETLGISRFLEDHGISFHDLNTANDVASHGQLEGTDLNHYRSHRYENLNSPSGQLPCT